MPVMPTPYDTLRTSMLALCAQTIEDFITTRAASDAAPPDAGDLRAARAALTSRLLDVIGDRGEQVDVGAR